MRNSKVKIGIYIILLSIGLYFTFKYVKFNFFTGFGFAVFFSWILNKLIKSPKKIVAINKTKQMNLTTKIKLIKDGKMPFKASEKAACYDLFAREIIETDNPNIVKVNLGVAIEPPEGFRVAIYPRSSIVKTGWMIANSVAVGDEDYRGEYSATFIRVNPEISGEIIGFNLYPQKTETIGLSYGPIFPYNTGDRCCQMEIVPYYNIDFIQVDELSETKRGDGGHGSTGK